MPRGRRLGLQGEPGLTGASPFRPSPRGGQRAALRPYQFKVPHARARGGGSRPLPRQDGAPRLCQPRRPVPRRTRRAGGGARAGRAPRRPPSPRRRPPAAPSTRGRSHTPSTSASEKASATTTNGTGSRSTPSSASSSPSSDSAVAGVRVAGLALASLAGAIGVAFRRLAGDRVGGRLGVFVGGRAFDTHPNNEGHGGGEEKSYE
jgi:hypothetical protein